MTTFVEQPEFRKWLQAHGVDLDAEKIHRVSFEPDSSLTSPVVMHVYGETDRIVKLQRLPGAKPGED